MNKTVLSIGVFSLLCLPYALLHGVEYWVHHDTGDDANRGSKGSPFKTIPHAAKLLEPGDTLHVIPASEPYPNDVRFETRSGTAADPIVINGHGSVISGWKQLDASEWKNEGHGVFSRTLENNAWGMETHWEGGFDLVHFNDIPGKNVSGREELTPGAYLLYKNRKESKSDPLHNTLFICLPEGETPNTVEVSGVTGMGGIYVGRDYITVKNFSTEYGGRDGFATFKNKGITFANVEARFFMDQGISNHGSEVTVLNSHFHHNAGGGIVDVYDDSVVRYENCLIESDTWRGGVEFVNGRYEMENCVIRGNTQKALAVSGGATVTLKNCLLIAPEVAPGTGILLGEGANILKISLCTIQGFDIGLFATLDSETVLEIVNSAWNNCRVNSVIRPTQRLNNPPVELANSLVLSGNRYASGTWTLEDRLQNTEGWNVTKEHFSFGEHADFATRIQTDLDAKFQAPLLRNPQQVGALFTERFPIGPQED